MRQKLRRLGLRSKAILFTVAIHGVLLALLFYSFNWANQIERGGAKPIQAVVISEQEILEQVEKQRQLEQQRKKEKEQAAKNLEELLDKQRQEKKKLEELARQRSEEEKKQRELEVKRKQEAEKKKKLAAEKKREAEAQKRKQEAEKKRKEEEKIAAEKKRKETEKKKQEAEKRRKEEEEEKRRRAEQLREQLEEEQRVKTRNDAGDALTALFDRIAARVEGNWRRPPTSKAGLTVIIRVKVARDGRVTSVRIDQSSGDRYFDQSAENAVWKASPLPFPENPAYYEFINEFNFKFNPDEI